MAWRSIGKKAFQASFVTTYSYTCQGNGPFLFLDFSKFMPNFYLKNVALLPRSWSFNIKNFHASFSSLSNTMGQAPGLKVSRNEKQIRRQTRTEAPAKAPYAPLKQKISSKHSCEKIIDIFEGMTIVELAKATGYSISSLQDMLVNIGEKVDSEFDPLSIDIAELLTMELGVNFRRLISDEGAVFQHRPAVVTVMGHVDHGKTSLLDALRQTSIAAKEAGGITQHLGAFVINMPSGASITVLDTPGHAAFSAMRARGAAVTDIVVLVVAADDGVMPQTLEAMSHAREANVPIVVAINKCDVPAADPERVRVQLGAEGLLLEDLGGDVQVVEVSAKTRAGLDKLDEAILLQAEMMDLKARSDGPCQAYVVEARLDRGRGPLVTAIVKSGTLICGQYIVVGSEWGRIRFIRNMLGRATASGRPAMPVEIEGLKGLPMAGDDVIVVDSEERARMLSNGRKKKLEKDRLLKARRRIEIEDTSESAPSTSRIDLPIIVKADVQGTVQAVTDALKSLNSAQVYVDVLHVGVGPISQSDVDLAQACNAWIVGFNVRTPSNAITLSANQANIKIFIHRIIYRLLEDVGNFIVERAPGTDETQVSGEGEVLSIFELKGRSKSKGPDMKIAGCRILNGHFSKSSKWRVLRSGEIIFEGSCVSLKREKHDVDEVGGKGNECGLVLDNCNNYKVGDIIQCVENVKRKPKFVSSANGAVRIEC
ncbi:hypothetical protein HPP92_017065 [Vanilla planifolia]|uniref:Translation initiation factor IF-2, mitochondrial n=1 Tax=Vanilla planifolia TaxID=51239 RepID=A0A835QH95_VANPL|nr:hypothetical protein HPP92_017065 [Vanilla planifolia]